MSSPILPESETELELNPNLLDDEDNDLSFYDSDDQFYDGTSDYTIHPVLAKDIDLLLKNYGSGTVCYRTYDQISEMNLEIAFSTELLEKTVADAWGLIHNEPIIILLNVEQACYLDMDSINSVDVYQKGNLRKSGALMQLKTIVEEFCRQQFRILTNEKVQGAVKTNLRNVPDHEKVDLLEMSFRQMDIFHAYRLSDGIKEGATNFLLEQTVNVPDHEKVDLLEMGFRQENIVHAYRLSDGTKEGAMNFLLEQTANVPDHEKVDLLEMGFRQENIVHAYRLSDGTKEGAMNFLLEQTASCNGEASFIDDRVHVPHNTSDPLSKNAKEIPSLGKGFLVQLHQYIEQRLPTLNSFCPICDNAHDTALCMMLKPVVCDNPLCIFSYQTLGVMAHVASAVISEPQVVNLLIHLAKAAIRSKRNRIILTSYPTIVHPRNSKEIAVHPDKPDPELLNSILTKIPHVQEMLKYNDAELKETLNKEDELCYPLLRWIISSNRSHIVKLPPNRQLAFISTKHQFLMRCSPPEEDRQFRRHKKVHGSVFAFHGSPIENWHSIIREGLIVATGTAKMIHGSAFGKGIYLSPCLATSIGYCRNFQIKNGKGLDITDQQERSQDYIQGRPEWLTCIALCEVINCESLKKHGQIWTCDDSAYVCTRFFFVYDQHNVRTNAVSATNTTTAEIHMQVKKAIAAKEI